MVGVKNQGPKCLLLGAEVSFARGRSVFNEGPKCLDEGPKCLFQKGPKCPNGAKVVGAKVGFKLQIISQMRAPKARAQSLIDI